MRSDLVRGCLDIHVHTAPETRLIARRQSGYEVAADARAVGMFGFVVKSHSTDTSARAQMIRELYPEVAVFGGVALNLSVGGLNAHAVVECARQGGTIVWMPTVSARHFSLHAEHMPRLMCCVPSVGETLVVARGDRLTSDADRVLDAVAEAGLVLASGHLAPDETWTLFAEAKRRGIQQLIVTHPQVPFVAMSLLQMHEFADLGAWLEITNSQTTEETVDLLASIPIKRCILSSDSGSALLDPPVESFAKYLSSLADYGIPRPDLYRMAAEAPRRLFGAFAPRVSHVEVGNALGHVSGPEFNRD